MAGPRLIVYCDESAKKGTHFSNFYGASIVCSENVARIESLIDNQKIATGLTCEIKWNNISPSTFERFISISNVFFDQIAAGNIKYRAMFTHNVHVPIDLTDDQKKNQYFLLYYQFIRNGLGLQYYNKTNGIRDLQLIFDQFPRHGKHAESFKTFLKKMNNRTLNPNGLNLQDRNIGEAKSHEHPILQCTDLVIGAMNFRLNDFNKAIPEGRHRRDKNHRKRKGFQAHF